MAQPCGGGPGHQHEASHHLFNSALEAGPTTVPFVGGWAYSAADFLKYVPAASGGFGYTELVAADNAVNTAEGTWGSGQNIFMDNSNRTLPSAPPPSSL